MRYILAASLLITMCGSANAATMHHANRGHAIVCVCPNQGMIALDPASGAAYAPPWQPIHYRSAPYSDYSEPSWPGYAPGERAKFIQSVRTGG